MSNNTKLATAPQTTTNYILKATSTTLGNSLVYDDGSGIAIGDTTASGFKFKVNGTTSLTGALSGTSATFSGAVSIGATAGTNGLFEVSNLGAGVSVGDFLVDAANKNVYVGRLSSTSNDNTNFIVRNRIGTELFKVTGNTGAATFSSSVTAGSDIFTYVNGGIFFNGGGSYGSGIFQQSGGTLALQTGSTPRLTIASTGAATFSSSVTANVLNTYGSGGLNSTAYQLNASISSNASASSVAPVARFSNNGGGYVTKIMFSDNNRGDAYITHYAGSAFDATTRYLGFGVDAVNQMIINANGNVGIGTSSPTAISNYTTLDIRGTNGSLLYMGTTSTASLRLIGEGTDAYIDNLTAGGALLFRTGSATERMRITSGGNVGIGTSSPSELLDIRGAYRDTSSGEFNQVIYSTTTQDVTRGGSIGFGGTTNGTLSLTTFAGLKGQKENGDGGNTAGALTFWTRPNAGAMTERMRITSSGNTIHKAYNVGEGILWNFNGGATYGFYNNNSGGFTLTNSGVANVGVFNMATGVYTPTSDFNKKKDFEESTIGLKELLQLKPTLYRMKTDDTEGNKELGFIAQEVKEFIPQAYVQSDDFIGLNFNPIVAALVKGMQEQQAQIEELKALISVK